MSNDAVRLNKGAMPKAPIDQPQILTFSEMTNRVLFTYLLAISSVAFGSPIQENDLDLYDLREREPTIFDEEEGKDIKNEAFILPLSKNLGEISGLAMDLKGRLVAFHRADREWNEKSFDENDVFNKELGPIKNSTISVIDKNNGKHNVTIVKSFDENDVFNKELGPIKNSTISVIDKNNGKIIEEHGKDLFYMPHGLTIDDKGNYWVTDVGSHQVHKLDKSFRPVLSLGEKLVPGNDHQHFCKPTDIAVSKNGYFFVADGYCNSRVLKFDPNGKLVDSFGAAIDDFGPSDFIVPHSLALIEDLNLICVADRDNERVQCFSAGLAEGHRTIPAGIPITSAEQLGRVYAIREKNHYLIGVTGRDEEDQLQPQLFVMDMNTGKANTFIEGIENAHALTVSDDGTVYISQMHPNQIIQISLPNQA
ncbi:NHL repeat protein [Dictyocaulus viviparus]|uniref:peptidylamidoglycolate lyase n=1 Tax=Dictyocaulus viviparus TaxID=29172 RepID=A0A0D8YFC9_DICVI|nr:NHL repeat protein [Dictyocaulus viviparus]